MKYLANNMAAVDCWTRDWPFAPLQKAQLIEEETAQLEWRRCLTVVHWMLGICCHAENTRDVVNYVTTTTWLLTLQTSAGFKHSICPHPRLPLPLWWHMLVVPSSG